MSRPGSSPHTRGAPAATVKAVIESRIIPAYAGSTRRRGQPRRRRTGSSPHTRGALALARRVSDRERIIPAYAGSTPRGPRSSAVFADHPRIRGEHRMKVFTSRGVQGSSPHTRGAQAGHSLAAGDARIIPAYAGSTPIRTPASRSREDHPRIRGEHRSTPCFFRRLSGSSPHTRGAQR